MTTTSTNGYTECEKLITSKFDKRDYSQIKLDNDMHVLLISDLETEKSAAAIRMGVGSLDEPTEFLGLAHFLEHMLFQGSEKFPNPSEYDAFFTDNGGSNNAYTDSHVTVYSFDCSNNGFYEGLDRTSSFFKHPIFDANYAEKEINAVNSEFVGNQQSDLWRKFEVLSNISDPKSFCNRFTIGNEQTLRKPGIREALLDFHKKYYSSNVGFACLYNNQPIEAMRKVAIDLLAGIPNNNATRPNYTDALRPFTASQCKKLTKINKIDEGQELSIYYPLPFYSPDQESSFNYIEFAVTHKCKGSLFQELFEKGWVTEIDTCGHDVKGKTNSVLMYIDISLTTEGLENYEQVVSAVCSYLNMLRSMEPEKWFHDELKLMFENDFTYAKKEEPYDTVEAIVGHFAKYKNENLIYNQYYLSEFDADRIKEQLSYMTSDNSFIFLSSDSIKFENDVFTTDKYFGVKYQTYDYSENLQTQMSTDIFKPNTPWIFPETNYYIAKNFDLLCETDPLLKGVEKADPKLILSEPGVDLWYKQDVIYKEPKAYICFQVYSQDKNKPMTPSQTVYAQLWWKQFENYISDIESQAQIASTEIVYDHLEDGIAFEVKCFNDSAQHVMERISERIVSFKEELNEKKFNTMKKDLSEDLNTFFLDTPNTQANVHKNNILNKNKLMTQKKLKACEECDFEGYKNYCQNEIWSKLFFHVQISGNITKDKCVKIYNIFRDSFYAYKNFEALERSEIARFPILNMARNEDAIYRKFLKSEDEKNSSMQKYYQLAFEGDKETRLRENYSLCLVMHFISNRFYNQLRTEQQLGYTVYAIAMKKRGIMGASFAIQGDKQEPNYVSQKITEFLESHYEQLKAQTNEDFEKSKAGYLQNITEKPLSLFDEAQALFTHQIYTLLYTWDYIEKRKQQVPTLTKEEALKVYKKIFIDDKKVLEVHMVSANMKEKYLAELEKRTYKNMNKELKNDEHVFDYYPDQLAYTDSHLTDNVLADI